MPLIVDRALAIEPGEAAILVKQKFVGCMAYIGGPAAGPTTKTWTPEKVAALRKYWTNFLPVWVSPVMGETTEVTSDAAAAVKAMEAFNWHPYRGRAIMLDTERDVYESAPDHVFDFVRKWAWLIYEAGFIPYQYGPRELLTRLGVAPSGTLVTAAVLPYYLGENRVQPVPPLSSRPELKPWAHGARAGWQYTNGCTLIPGHPVFDVSVVSLPLNP